MCIYIHSIIVFVFVLQLLKRRCSFCVLLLLPLLLLSYTTYYEKRRGCLQRPSLLSRSVRLGV